MSLHDDLLSQAEKLSQLERTRPKQVSLRRAISAAYYSLFHLLTHEAARLFAKSESLVHCIERTLNHNEMRLSSMQFLKGDLPKAFDSIPSGTHSPAELKIVCQAFILLQEARHDADYNFAISYTRHEAQKFVSRAKQAFAEWRKIRTEDAARLYLASFLLWEKWNKSR